MRILIQLTAQNPTMFITHSTTTRKPRQLDFAESACHTGAVEVFKPLPMPATILPTIICAREYDVVCRAAPMAMIVVPMMIVRLRPR